MQVPPFLLRRLYVKGSLKNTQEGFQFRLSNILGSGYAEALLPLSVDGEEVAAGDATFTVEGESDVPTPFAAVTAEQPFTLEMNKTTVIHVRGRTLAPGEHRIAMGFVVVGLGEMAFEVADEVADG